MYVADCANVGPKSVHMYVADCATVGSNAVQSVHLYVADCATVGPNAVQSVHSTAHVQHVTLNIFTSTSVTVTSLPVSLAHKSV